MADVVDLPKVGFSVLNDEWDEAEGSRDITFEVNHVSEHPHRRSR